MAVLALLVPTDWVPFMGVQLLNVGIVHDNLILDVRLKARIFFEALGITTAAGLIPLAWGPGRDDEYRDSWLSDSLFSDAGGH
jgi:hypothetical protein